MHIGLIGGIGPAATEFYYRGLIDRHERSGTRLELTIAHADVREMARNLAARDARAQAQAFAPLIRRLAAAGARAAAVTSMGGHFCIRELEPISALPLINALPAVDAAIRQRGYRRVGIIGTRMVMETRLYGAISSAAVVTLEGADFEEVHENYSAMAIAGRVTDAQRRVFFEAGRRLVRDLGADVVLLGGTDLFLAFQGQDSPFPVLDSADIHVGAVYDRSLASP
jgi:aspartate racemase